jgi:hypothetical protein
MYRDGFCKIFAWQESATPPTTKRFQINELPRITDCNGDKIDLIGRSSLCSLQPGSLSKTGEGGTGRSDRTVPWGLCRRLPKRLCPTRIFGSRANSRGGTMSGPGQRPGLGKIALLLALQPSHAFDERVPSVHERDHETVHAKVLGSGVVKG